MRNIISPCRIGNSSVCPKRSWKLASIENTDPSLTLRFCAYLFSIISFLKNSIFVNLSIFLSMSIIRPWSARLVACQTFWLTGAPYWTWKCAWSWYSWKSSRPFQSSQYFNIRNALQYNYARKPHPLAGMVLRLKVQSKHLKSQLDPPVGDGHVFWIKGGQWDLPVGDVTFSGSKEVS